MSRNNHNEPARARVVRYSFALLMFMALFAVPRAHALDTGDIVIVGLKGEVHVTMKGAERAVKAGSVLELPATVQTGRDGAIDLRQGETSVSVGPDTLLEFPALEKAGGPIDRIVQPRGNAFYSIGKRGPRKLRVETPYLVGVVKGTQFNVSAQDTKTTISLFEGLLEIRASDDSSAVDIKAGEIATRSLTDTSIGVLEMEPGKAVPPPRAPQISRSEAGKLPAEAAPHAPSVARSAAASGTPESGESPNSTGSSSEQILVGPVSDITASVLPAVDVQREVEVEPELRGGVDVVAAASPDVADAVSVPIDMSYSGIDVAPAISVVEGAATPVINVGSVDVGGGAAITPPVVVEPHVNVDVDLGGTTGIADTVTAAIDVGIGSGPPGGPPGGGEGTGVVLDLGGDHAATQVDVGVVNAAADVTPGNVDLGVSLGNTDVNVDLGLGDDGEQGGKGPGNGNAYGNGNGNAYGNDNGNGNANGYGNGAGSDDSGTPGNSGKGHVVDDVVDTVDDALKGLLRKPGKK